MRFRTRALLLLAFVAGCDRVPPTAPADSTHAPAATAVTWNEQLDAVRAGRAQEIRMTTPVTADQIRELASGCEELSALVLNRAEFDEASLESLATLPKLRWIKTTSPVDDTAAAALRQCHALEIVNLPNATISDAGLADLATLPHLELLRIGSPNVTDAGLEPLTQAPRLKFLHLLDVNLSDEGLKHVEAITTLESFYLDGQTSTTDAGLHALLKARPDLHFHKDQHHLPGDPNAHRHE